MKGKKWEEKNDVTRKWKSQQKFVKKNKILRTDWLILTAYQPI